MGHSGGVKLWAVCVVAGAFVQSACSSTDGTTPVEVGGSGSAGAAHGGAGSVGGSAGASTAGSNAVAGTGNATNGGGTSGADGASGSAGSSGVSGISGAAGAGGTSGAAGSAGHAGSTGAAGSGGAAGHGGTGGAAGSAGHAGSNGTAGAGGTSGHGGASGSAGSGGTAGTGGNGGSAGSATQFDKYGWPPPAYATTASIAADGMAAYKVVIPASTLDSLGISLGASTGSYRLALYTDGGNVPGSLIKGSDLTSALYGTNTANVDDVALTAGTYWIAFRFSASTALPYGGNVSTATLCNRTASISATSVWPQTFGSAACATAAPSNVWVTTYH